MATPPQPVHEAPPPQAKLPGARPFRATRKPEVLPVPYIPFPIQLISQPGFAPKPPGRGFFLWDEMPRVKLRGLGPADSLIVRHAVVRKLLDPNRILLSPLIPWTPPTEPAYTNGPTRNLLKCPDAPLQPDAILPKIPPPGPPAPDPFGPAMPPGIPIGPATQPPGPFVLEVKPNAGYVAVGQVLCYFWAWMNHYGDAYPLSPAILTDLPRPYMPEFCASLGITLMALGDMLVEPPPWPT